MGDSMEKGTNKKKTTTGTNKKKSTGTKNTTAKKGATTKKVSNNVAKNGVSTVKAATAPEKEIVQVTTKPVVKETNSKLTEKNDKNIISPVKTIETEHGEKLNKKKEKLVVEDNEFTNLIKIVLIVTGIFLAFYLITYLVAKNKANDTDKETDTPEVSIQYDEILMSNLLKQSSSEYYVLAYDAKDVYYDTYNTYITSYTGKDDAIRVYTSILSNSFNKAYYDKDAESNTDITSINELKLNSSTLIKVKDGKIQATYEGHDAIVTHLKTLID
jgi:hypothetical protein